MRYLSNTLFQKRLQTTFSKYYRFVRRENHRNNPKSCRSINGTKLLRERNQCSEKILSLATSPAYMTRRSTSFFTTLPRCTFVKPCLNFAPRKYLDALQFNNFLCTRTYRHIKEGIEFLLAGSENGRFGRRPRYKQVFFVCTYKNASSSSRIMSV